MDNKKIRATEEQLAYASVLDRGMKIGLLAIVVTFLSYVTGIFAPHLPLDELPKYWSMPIHEYLKAADIHTGWWWLGMVGKGDFLNFIGIAFLASVTVACFFPLVLLFLKKKDKVYATMAAMEVLILVLAASGVLKAGGH